MEQASPGIGRGLQGRPACPAGSAAEGVDLILRLGPLTDSGMTGRRLGAYRRWLVAAPDVAKALDARASLGDQLRDRCIVYSGSTLGARWRLDGPGDAVVFEASGAVTAGAGAVVRGLAVSGAGVALLPSFAVRADLAGGRLVRVAPEWPGPSIDLSALWTHRELPRKGRVFLDYLSPLLTLDEH